MDEIHDVAEMKLAELREWRKKGNNGEGLPWRSPEFLELTAQGDKVKKHFEADAM